MCAAENVGERTTFRLVIKKHLFYAQSEPLVVKEDICLEIVLKAAEIDVCASA